ncbi:hypothetical protein Q3G72_029714 [Acer saccharum]|nr:hypothetical protein Q3G72_029714 [Acer saccharum]
MLQIDPYKMAEIEYLSVVALLLCLLTISKLHFSDSKPSGFSIKLIPRDSPESPIYPVNLSQFERIKFNRAESNYAQFLSTTRNATPESDLFFVPLRDISHHFHLLYMGEVGIGTPLRKVLISLIYTCVNGECIYDTRYGSGGSSGNTKGVASMESFVFPTNRGQSTTTIVTFGCSNVNQNFVSFQHNGYISGIMGLDLSPNSLSNCKQKVANDSHIVSFLKKECEPLSGVPITRIAQHTNGVDAYDVVMRAFEEYYDSKHLHRRGRRGAFRSCYNKQPGFDAFPTLTYNFQGADYVVDGKNVDFNYNYEGFFCVGIVPGAGVSILGAVHMQSMRIIHDGNIGAVQFYPENCADEHL